MSDECQSSHRPQLAAIPSSSNRRQPQQQQVHPKLATGDAAATRAWATDELGMHAVDKVCTMHDLHATVLHLLGIDHERLTFRHGGRDHRLTDVHGHVIKGVLA
jgi:catechol 2,3-dioxygenase-like lactoylglutathione lyase family enzyme